MNAPCRRQAPRRPCTVVRRRRRKWSPPNLGDVAEVWRRGSVVASWLLDLTAIALFGQPDLSKFSGRVSDSGEYRGEVPHQGTIYPGEQPAIVEGPAFERAGALLWEAQPGAERTARNSQAAALQGLLACGVCGSRMAPGYTTKGGRRYRYGPQGRHATRSRSPW